MSIEQRISRQLALYCHYWDDAKMDEFAALFTEDASFTFFGKTYVGRDTIGETFADMATRTGVTQHLTSNIVITQTSISEATAESDFALIRPAKVGFKISIAGRYIDRWTNAHTDDHSHWLLAERVVRNLGPTKVAR